MRYLLLSILVVSLVVVLVIPVNFVSALHKCTPPAIIAQSAEDGENEAKIAGKLLKEGLFDFDLVFTSLLKRANRTMQLCLDEMKISKINKKKGLAP